MGNEGTWVLKPEVPISREDLTFPISPLTNILRKDSYWLSFSCDHCLALWSEWGRWGLLNSCMARAREAAAPKGRGMLFLEEEGVQGRRDHLDLLTCHRRHNVLKTKYSQLINSNILFIILRSVCMHYLEGWRGSKVPGLIHLWKDRGMHYQYF